MPIPTHRHENEAQGGKLDSGAFQASALQIEERHPLLSGYQSIAADAAGDTDIAERLLLSAYLLRNVDSVDLELAYDWAATADGSISLVTAGGTTIVSKSFVGGESSPRDVLTVDVNALKAQQGQEVFIRVSITAAGGAGETVTLRRAHLVVRKDLSKQ